jgi:hypothetical protein
VGGIAAWGTLALWFAGPGPVGERAGLAAVWGALGAIALYSLARRRVRKRNLAVFVAAWAVLLGWWRTIRPSNDRDWRPEVATLSHATFEGDLVTVHDIRNFDYRTETDFTRRTYDRTFDLRRLDAMDLVACYWMGPAIAHIFLSFGFGDDHVAISIEARKERSEGYSTLGGLFKQYELIYIVGDERDLIRLRTNFRKDAPEDVYLYRLQGPLDRSRRIFVDYLKRVNELRERPAFYDTIHANCTNSILIHTRVNQASLPFSWKILLSGYTPEYAWEGGRLDRSVPFEELQRRSRINDAARAADRSPEFSRLIRAHLEAPEKR